MLNLITDTSSDFLDLTALEAAFFLAQQRLQNFALDPEFTQKMALAFGEGFNGENLSNMDFGFLPVQVLTRHELNGANGAFSSTTNKIYIAREFIQANGIEAIAGLLLEEIGHKIDSLVNEADSPGDEGAIFAALVLGESLDVNTLQVLKVENDHATIIVNGQSVLVEQQNFTGTNGNDTITGTAGDDTINPGRGFDDVNGRAGNDLLIVDYSGITTGSMYNSGFGGFNGYFYTTNGIDRVIYSSIERFQITGTIGNDSIYTGSGNDSVNGGAGNDSISAGSGNDTINGGDGNDVLTDDFSTSTSNLTFNFAGTTPITPTETSITNIEAFNLTTGSGNDSITLNGIYNDTLSAGAGDDTINPGRGIDNVLGEAGNDLLIVDYSGITTGSMYINGATGFNGYVYTTDGIDQVSYSSIERFQITGTSGNDSIYTGSGNDSVNGGAGNDSISAGSGNDTINGGDGNDVLTDDFSTSTSNLTFNFAGTTPITPTGTSITNIEAFNLTTGSGNDSITLNGIYNDTLSAGAGDDTINPGRGIDNVLGEAGNDLLIVDYSGKTTGSMSTTGGTGFNGYVYTTDGIDQVSYSSIERFQITGTSRNDNIYTGSGNDSVNGGTGKDLISAGSGNDILIGVNQNSINPGQGEVDSLTGGAGNDKFILGDSTWIGYDDGLNRTSGNNDYAQIADFNPTDDIIQLRGSSSDYLLTVSRTNTNLYINKPGTEPDELIAILQNRIGLTLIGSYFNYVSISNLPTITLAVSPASVTEDGTPNLVYTFTRSGVTTNALTVNYSIAGTANSTDYTGAAPGTGKTITFAPGSSTATLTIDPTTDATIEVDETVALTLATGTGYTVATTTAVTGTILNDDLSSITRTLTTNVENLGNDLFLVTTARSGFTNAGAITALTATGIGAKLTPANFAANYADQFTFGTSTFVAINDNPYTETILANKL